VTAQDLTPEALAAEIDKIAESYAEERRRCEASGDQQGKAVNSAINVTYRADAKRIRETLVPAWDAKDGEVSAALATVARWRHDNQRLIEERDAAQGRERMATMALDEELAEVRAERDALAAELVQLRESAEYAAEAGAAIAVVEEREQRGQPWPPGLLAVYDRYKADEVSAAGAWGDVVCLVEGIPGTLPDDDVHVDWHMTAAEQAQLFGVLRQHADVPYIAALIAAGAIPAVGDPPGRYVPGKFTAAEERSILELIAGNPQVDQLFAEAAHAARAGLETAPQAAIALLRAALAAPGGSGQEADGEYPPVPDPPAAWVTLDDLADSVRRCMPRIRSDIERADGWMAAHVEDPRDYAWGLLQQCAGWDPDAEPPGARAGLGGGHE
jgi:hypothetical protein